MVRRRNLVAYAGHWINVVLSSLKFASTGARTSTSSWIDGGNCVSTGGERPETPLHCTENEFAVWNTLETDSGRQSSRYIIAEIARTTYLQAQGGQEHEEDPCSIGVMPQVPRNTLRAMPCLWRASVLMSRRKVMRKVMRRSQASSPYRLEHTSEFSFAQVYFHAADMPHVIYKTPKNIEKNKKQHEEYNQTWLARSK